MTWALPGGMDGAGAMELAPRNRRALGRPLRLPTEPFTADERRRTEEMMDDAAFLEEFGRRIARSHQPSTFPPARQLQAQGMVTELEDMLGRLIPRMTLRNGTEADLETVGWTREEFSFRRLIMPFYREERPDLNSFLDVGGEQFTELTVTNVPIMHRSPPVIGGTRTRFDTYPYPEAAVRTLQAVLHNTLSATVTAGIAEDCTGDQLMTHVPPMELNSTFGFTTHLRVTNPMRDLFRRGGWHGEDGARSTPRLFPFYLDEPSNVLLRTMLRVHNMYAEGTGVIAIQPAIRLLEQFLHIHPLGPRMLLAFDNTRPVPRRERGAPTPQTNGGGRGQQAWQGSGGRGRGGGGGPPPPNAGLGRTAIYRSQQQY